MEFRSQKTVAAFLMVLSSALAAGPPFSAEVRHRHMHGAGTGTLRVSADGVAFEETGKKSDHSRTWKFDDLQQFELSIERIRIITYEDVRWQFGRDREYVFDDLPDGFAADLNAFLADRLDQRYVAALATGGGTARWEMAAKMLEGRNGANGMLRVADDRIVFETEKDGVSRTWRINDIQNVASAGRFELTLTTYERAAWHHGAPREVRLQLKQPLTDERYNSLWRSVQRAQGLDLFPFTRKEMNHD